MSFTTFSRALLAFAVLAAAPTTAAAALPNPQRTVLSVGHVDAVAPVYQDEQLRLRVKDDTGVLAAMRDPGDVLLHAKPESEIVIPGGLPPEWSFLGDPGNSVWLLPETQDPNLLWPGFSSELFPAGVLAGETMTWRLLAVDGPGSVFLYDHSSFGVPTRRFDTADGLPDALQMGVGVHAHFSWAFTARGLYKLTFQVDGTGVGGSARSSGPVQYRFFVGDLADLPPEPQTTLSIGGAKTSYTVGETIALTALQDPVTAFDHYRWSMKCGSLGFAEVGGGATHTTTAALADDGCQVKATLFDDGQVPIATSAPLTLRIDEAPAPPQPPTPPGPPAPPAAPPPPATPLTLASAGTRARRLIVTLRLAARSRVGVRVLRRGRTIALARARPLDGGSHTLRVRLPHRLAPGRYTIRVRAATGATHVTRTIVLAVPATRGGGRSVTAPR
jgi:surface-anchored protein